MMKSELRKTIRERKRCFAQEELDEMAFAIISRLTVHPRFAAARTVMLYHSLPDEVDTHHLLAAMTASSAITAKTANPLAGKTILLPRVTSDTGMELRIYTGPDDMQRGAFGIMEPCGSVFTRYGEVDLAVIPGMAFDAAGHRLGRGKGYYDRFLPLIPQAYKIGVCFPFQIVDSVPTEPTDVAMDEVMWEYFLTLNRYHQIYDY